MADVSLTTFVAKTKAKASEINANFASIKAVIESLGTDNYGTATVTDAILASQNNSAFKPLLYGFAMSPGTNVGTGAYAFAGGVTPQAPGVLAPSGSTYANFSPTAILPFDDADAPVSLKTQKLRTRMAVLVGSSGLGSAVITAGLYPVTTGSNTWILGAPIATVASSGTSANNVFQFVGSEVSIPTDGIYALGVTITGATVPVSNSIYVHLQTRHT